MRVDLPPSEQEFSLASRLLSNPGVDREVEVPVDAGRDVHSGWPEPEADLWDRAERDGVVPRFEVDGVSAVDPGANTGYGLAST